MDPLSTTAIAMSVALDLMSFAAPHHTHIIRTPYTRIELAVRVERSSGGAGFNSSRDRLRLRERAHTAGGAQL